MAALMVALTAVALSACGGSSSDSSSSTSEASSEPASGNEAESVNASDKGPLVKDQTIGIIYFFGADQTSVRQGKAVEEAAHKLGWKTTAIDANLDPSKETAAFTTLINQGVNGIATINVSNTELQPSIKQAESAGIPVMSIGGGGWVPGLALDVALDDRSGAAELGTYFYDTLSKQYGTKPVDVIQMDYPEGNPCRARETIFDAIATEFPTVNVTKYKVDAENLVPAASSYVSSQINQKGDDLVGVISCWGAPAQGALAAAKQAGLDNFMVVGMNGETAELDLIAEEDPYYTATIAFAWAWAGDELINWMDKDLAGDMKTPPTGRIYIPQQLVTSETPPKASQYDLILPAGWSPDYWK
jgi:ribose transport system substrate-binding protein